MRSSQVVTPFQGDTLHQFRHYMHQPSCLASLDLRLGRLVWCRCWRTRRYFGPDPSVQLRWSYGRNVPKNPPLTAKGFESAQLWRLDKLCTRL